MNCWNLKFKKKNLSTIYIDIKDEVVGQNPICNEILTARAICGNPKTNERNLGKYKQMENISCPWIGDLTMVRVSIFP